MPLVPGCIEPETASTVLNQQTDRSSCVNSVWQPLLTAFSKERSLRTCPSRSRRTSAWPSLPEREQLAAAQLLAKHNSSRAVGSVQLKDVLGEIQSDGAHLVHGRLLEWPATPSLWHTTAAGGVHTITATAVATGRRWVKLPKLDIGSTARRACTQDRAASPLEKRRLISAPTSDRLSDWEG